MRNIRDYYAGGKNLGFFSVAFSARATGESSWLLLGLTGTGFAVGAQGFWIVLGELIGVGGAWLLLARRFKRLTDKYDSLTIPDYLESRFRDKTHWLRLIAAGSLVVFVPIYAAANIFATGKSFNAFLDMNHFLGATIGFAVVLLYITKGGFVAVVWSDVFQGTLMVLGLVALPLAGVLELGGVTNVLDSLRDTAPNHLSITAGNGFTPLTVATIIGFAAIGIGFLGSPQVFVRFISLRSEDELRKGAAVAILWTILADSGAVLVGMAGRALYDLDTIGGDSDNILPFMSDTLFPAFISGIFIAIVLSAIMSTIDSLLIVASSSAVRDYWQKVRHPEMSDERLMKTSQLLTLVLALIAFAVGIGILLYDKENGVFWIIIFGWSGIAATFCPTIILSLFWTKLTARGAKAAMLAGFVSVPFFKFAAPPLLEGADLHTVNGYLTALDVLPPAFLVSFVVAVLVSLTDREGQDRVHGAAADLAACAEPPPTDA